MSYWLVKSEPFKYSWDQFVKDKQTFWNGVRNYAARNNMRAMKNSFIAYSAACNFWPIFRAEHSAMMAEARAIGLVK